MRNNSQAEVCDCLITLFWDLVNNLHVMKTIGIIANLNKPNVSSVTKRIIGIFERYGIGVLLEKPLAKILGRSGVSEEILAKKVDLLIALGGDGTFLRVARIVQKNPKPILGINLGGLGFLSEVTLDSLRKDVGLLIKGKYRIDYRMTLDTKVSGKRNLPPALNDVVISKHAISRLINIDVSINGEFVTEYRADGIIVSTPTGSTAYNLSAGGPIVKPGSNVIIITPICPHTLTQRPLVIPCNNIVEIGFRGIVKDVELTIDGQIGVGLDKDDKVIVTEGKEKVPVVLFEDSSYFDVLRQKLGWGSR